MSFEIEMKAHIAENKINEIKEKLNQTALYVGSVDKTDVYWSTSENGPLLFRTRKQKLGDKTEVLFTKKPFQERKETEINQEIEYTAASKDWDKIQKFYKALNYKICLKKNKKGFEWFYNNYSGEEIHVELLSVNNLGWFFEAEITFEDGDANYIKLCQRALFSLFASFGLTEEIERKSYRSMIQAKQ